MSSGIDLGEGRADPIRVSLLYPSPYGLASEPRIDPTRTQEPPVSTLAKGDRNCAETRKLRLNRRPEGVGGWEKNRSHEPSGRVGRSADML